MATHGLVAPVDGPGRSYQLEQYDKNISEGLLVFTSLSKYLHCREISGSIVTFQGDILETNLRKALFARPPVFQNR